MAAQQVDPDALELIQRPGLRGGEQFQGLAERAGLQAGLRRGQDASGVPRRIGGQRHRSFKERRGRGQPAAGLRPAGRTLELRGNLLVRPGSGLGPVPGPAVRIGLRVGRLGQRRVHLLPVRERGRAVGRRARQRMPEPDPGAELDQARLHRRRPRLDADAQPPGRPPDQRPVPGRIGRRQLQQPPGLVRQGGQLAAGSCPRSGRSAARRRAARTRPPAPPGSARAAAPATPAGYPGSRR